MLMKRNARITSEQITGIKRYVVSAGDTGRTAKQVADSFALPYQTAYKILLNLITDGVLSRRKTPNEHHGSHGGHSFVYVGVDSQPKQTTDKPISIDGLELESHKMVGGASIVMIAVPFIKDKHGAVARISSSTYQYLRDHHSGVNATPIPNDA